MEQEVYDILIIGGGPAGYTAGLYAARAGLKTAVLEKTGPGGQMQLTDRIDNYPGFPDGIDGFTLSQQMQSGAEKHGAKTILTTVNQIRPEGYYWALNTDQGDVFGKAVIISTGAVPRKLEIPGESELIGRGVSYCAACDGMFFKDKTVCIVGGGNTAVGDAVFLSKLCKKVYLIHRRDTLRASDVLQKTVRKAENVEIIWNSRVIWLHGTDVLTACTVQNIQTGTLNKIFCDGIFVAIGRKPSADLFRASVAVNAHGYIITDSQMQTNRPGIFAAGDVRNTNLRQILTAAADGAIAAQSAAAYVKENFE